MRAHTHTHTHTSKGVWPVSAVPELWRCGETNNNSISHTNWETQNQTYTHSHTILRLTLLDTHHTPAHTHTQHNHSHSYMQKDTHMRSITHIHTHTAHIMGHFSTETTANTVNDRGGLGESQPKCDTDFLLCACLSVCMCVFTALTPWLCRLGPRCWCGRCVVWFTVLTHYGAHSRTRCNAHRHVHTCTELCP